MGAYVPDKQCSGLIQFFMLTAQGLTHYQIWKVITEDVMVGRWVFLGVS